MRSIQFGILGLSLIFFPAPLSAQKAEPAPKTPLSLSISLNKKAFVPDDPIELSFALKNISGHDVFVGDGYLGPKYTEVGPQRHFEVHVTANGKSPLYFWSGMATEGQTAGIRKVFRLKPGADYKGKIRLSAGYAKDRDYAKYPHEIRGGSFEDKNTKKPHILGKDAQKYSVRLLYQVQDETHGVWKPPADFQEKLLWKGKLFSNAIDFEVNLKADE